MSDEKDRTVILAPASEGSVEVTDNVHGARRYCQTGFSTGGSKGGVGTPFRAVSGPVGLHFRMVESRPCAHIGFPKAAIKLHGHTTQVAYRLGSSGGPLCIGTHYGEGMFGSEHWGNAAGLFSSASGQYHIEVALHAAGTIELGFPMPEKYESAEGHSYPSAASASTVSPAVASSTAGPQEISGQSFHRESRP